MCVFNNPLKWSNNKNKAEMDPTKTGPWVELRKRSIHVGGDYVNVYWRILLNTLLLIAIAPNTFRKEKPPPGFFHPKVSLAPPRQTSPPLSCFAHQPAFLCLWQWLLTVWTQQGGPAHWHCKCQQSPLTGLFYESYTTATCRAAVTLSGS